MSLFKTSPVINSKAPKVVDVLTSCLRLPFRIAVYGRSVKDTFDIRTVFCVCDRCLPTAIYLSSYGHVTPQPTSPQQLN